MARYTDQHGRSFQSLDMEDKRQQHKVAKHVAKSLLTPPQLAAYEEGKFNISIVDELGRRHLMLYAKPGVLLGRGG